MIIVLLIVVFIKYSNANVLEDLFSQNFVHQITSPPTTVSPVAQFYTSDSSDFIEMTKSDFFVDNTMLIQELFDSKVSAFLEISAAPHFGKSTNLDMIKRFLEINVEEKGRRVSSELSNNYKAFTQNNLQITKHKQVFDKHFGKYPVISISYKPLETVTKFDFLLKKYRVVLLETFTRHKYLLHAEHFWNNSKICKDDFVKYLYEKSNVNLNQSDIEKGFAILADTLSNYFKTHVVVLVDNYDIIVDAPVSEDCRDAVYDFIVGMNNRIIESSSVSRVIITGSLLRGGIPFSPKIKSASETCPKLLKYYGLSENDLQLLLQRFLKNRTEIDDAMHRIVKDYSGYVRSFEAYDEMKTNPRRDVVCSVWSVVQYLTCVRKINIGNIGETDALSLTYLSIPDRASFIETF